MLLTLLGLYTAIGKPSGPFDVSTTFYRFPNSVQSKVFYPCLTDNSENLKKANYVRESVIKGLATFSQYLPEFLIKNVLSTTNHPYWYNAVPAPPPTKEGWPILVFSHGLFGNSEIYANFCGEIASHGYVVYALEHEDGSATYSSDKHTGEPIYYKHPPSIFKYNRENCQAFRQPQIQQRVEDISRVSAALMQQSNNNNAIKRDFSSKENFQYNQLIVDSKKMTLAGHSFGGATVATYAHQHGKSSPFIGYVLLDIWPMPLNQTVIDNGIPHLPVISILSNEFAKYQEAELTKQLLHNSNPACKLHAYIEHSTHTQFSDMPYWIQNPLYSKYLYPSNYDQVNTAIYHPVLRFIREPSTFTPSKVDDIDNMFHLAMLNIKSRRTK